MTEHSGGLVRPAVTEHEAVAIAHKCYGLEVTARELGSNQDRNFLLEERSGRKFVLRIDNAAFPDSAREAQHAAIEAYRAASVPVASVLPSQYPSGKLPESGALTTRWNGLAVRLNEFVDGSSLVDAGYLAPVVLREFGALAARSVQALVELEHPGLEREHMWDMRVAAEQTIRLSAAITDSALRERVQEAVAEADTLLAPVVDHLPVQAIHGDLTDDNVIGSYGDDARLHPQTVLDLGDLSYGWRVAELAVTVSSMLHHDESRPLRVLDTISAFHEISPLSQAEARALWPLVVLRASLLVASGWRQLEIDGDNDYARERIAGEQAIFDASRLYSVVEMTEQVLSRLGMLGEMGSDGSVRLSATHTHPEQQDAVGLGALLPGLESNVVVLDPGVESAALDGGAWLGDDAEQGLITAAFAQGHAAAVLPYGVYRLTRTQVNSADAAATWPIDTEIWVDRRVANATHAAGAEASLDVCAPVTGTVLAVDEESVRLELTHGWILSIAGFRPAVAVGHVCATGERIGTLEHRETMRSMRIGIHRADAPMVTTEPDRAALVAPERVPAWSRLSRDPARVLGLESLAQRDESDDEQQRRERAFASAQERYYERPMQVQRGWRHHLVDTTGRSYVDMVNNVSGLGHGHPGVADAVNRQIRLLNTNSRFLYRELAEYSERLLALLPEGSELDTVLLVNSGSEAVDLALRVAQAATGRRTVVALREAYHGWTMASDAVTTSAYDNPNALASRPDWIHIADVPNRFRGTYRGDAADLSVGAKYAADLGSDLDTLAAKGRDVAGFICESVLGNAGGVMLPDGYLTDVYARVRAAGGLCIADEVQVGFGRMGSSFWGFEQSGVMPDIITIAKPMGNGFPIGGVITSKRIADALSDQGQFFSSAGGNPLSCMVGIAVLDAMEEEKLQENAQVVGAKLIAGFTALAEKYEIIGPIHGEGLYLGVELVRDRETMEPAKEEAAAICERLKDLGVVVLTTSERSNVLKVKPPLCLTAESADFVVEQLELVLSTGW
ncbi:aminotransferase [Leucobacter denitrificans]|uniref:Aminotransferase n=1 Tax=Leucobacter denitrificans TaxID=683042 RepID=A0A7G9S593_9MICO|nr:aminotransferase [Leucobacter denitrificans]QNN63018.1 aminotransferase [Leucobacter denitrificans]